MQNLSVFKFEESKEVRTVMMGEEIYFVGKDVAAILGYARPTKAVQDHCKGVLKQDAPTSGGVQELSIIPERDVYRLIMRSKLPSAERFEEWVVGTVLPSLRKTGGYMIGEENAQSEDEIIYLAMQMMQKKIAAMKPKVEYHDKWMSSKGSFTTTDIAKQLGVSAIKLNNFMREQGIKWKNKDLPISGYEHWFKVIDIAYNKDQGETGIKKQCRITPEGAKNIVSLWEKKAG